MSRAALEASPSTTAVPATPGAERPVAPAARPRALDWIEQPLVACALLMVIYAGLSFLNDPRGTLLADSGGKLATLQVMDARSSFDPDVGYWAAAEDPKGVLHPLHFTVPIGDEFLQASTLPMLYASYPLYELGGGRAVLALPMLGAVLCALAARAIARRYGASTGWTAFWAVGLATPVTVYALAFWEHTLGLAFMLWAFVVLVDVTRRRAGWRGAVAAGALFGVAAVLRTEALVYFAVTMLVLLTVLVVRDRRMLPATRVGASALVGASAVLLANHLLEILTVGSSIRAGRTAGAAVAATAAMLSDRLEEATTTATGLNGFNFSIDWIVGAVIVLLIGGGAWCLARARGPRVLGGAMFGLACVLYAMRFSVELGYIPGFLSASPLAAAGIALVWGRRDLWMPVVIACLAVPLIWATQYSDSMRPQWGGRYALTSGVLLAVVTVVALAGKRVALAAVLAVSVLVTGFGLAFLVQRSHSIADGMATITARRDRALISMEPHLLREGGAFYEQGRHWLTASDPAQVQKAVRIVTDAGDRELALLVPELVIVPSLDGWVRGDTQRLRVRPDEILRVVTFRLK